MSATKIAVRDTQMRLHLQLYFRNQVRKVILSTQNFGKCHSLTQSVLQWKGHSLEPVFSSSSLRLSGCRPARQGVPPCLSLQKSGARIQDVLVGGTLMGQKPIWWVKTSVLVVPMGIYLVDTLNIENVIRKVTFRMVTGLVVWVSSGIPRQHLTKKIN